MKNWLIVLLLVITLFFLIYTTETYGMAKQRLLIYGFKNVTKRVDDSALNIKLSIFLYDQISNVKKNRYKPYLVDKLKESSGKLNINFATDKDYLYEIGKEKGFDLILYGFYDVEGGKLKVFPKLFIVDRKIVVNADRLYPTIYNSVKEAEKLGFYKLINYESKKKLKYAHIDYQLATKEMPLPEVGPNAETSNNKKPEASSPRIFFEISNHNGFIFPTDIWDTLYSSGFFTDIDLSILSSKRSFPVSLTFHTRYSIMDMSGNGEYIDSELGMFYLGLGLDYNLHLFKFLDTIRFSGSGGFTNTLLKINNKDFESIDPTGSIELSLIFKMSKTLKLRLGFGGIYVSYINCPFEALYSSVGIIFGK